jgi:hypothetical protein
MGETSGGFVERFHETSLSEVAPGTPGVRRNSLDL